MSHDRKLDEIMEMDINPQGPSVELREARFRDKFLAESEEMFRLDPIDEGAVNFAFGEGDRVNVEGVSAVVKECRGYRQGHAVVPRYLVEADDGRQAEVGEAQIKSTSTNEALEHLRILIEGTVSILPDRVQISISTKDRGPLPDEMFARKKVTFVRESGNDDIAAIVFK